MSILLAVLIIGILIFFHELGHYIGARAAGIRVHEFALGMGPVLFSTTRGHTKYTLRMLPIGGFLRVAGEEGEEGDVPISERYDGKPLLARAGFVVGGALMNFLLAIVVFILIFTFMGVPTTEPIIGDVNTEGAAHEAGIKPGDRVLRVGSEPIENWGYMQQAVARSPEQSVEFVVSRDGAQLSFMVTPRMDESLNRALIGVHPEYSRFNVLHAVYLGVRETIWFTAEIVLVIVRMVTGQVPAEGAGPIGIVVMVGQVARTGVLNLLSFAAIISIQLGLFQLLPIPALDGSKLAFLLIEGVRGRPIDPEWENMVHLVGFALLMGFLVLITFKDLQRLNIF